MSPFGRSPLANKILSASVIFPRRTAPGTDNFRSPMSIVRTLTAFTVAGVSSLGATASTVGVSNAGYSIRTWQTEDGLPQNSVTAIAQTRDGYIWIGTFGGLARFDGERFQTFEAVNTPQLTDSRIAALFEDAEGVLWIGHDSGKVTRYRDGKFEAFTTSTGSHEKILSIGSDPAGMIWFLRQNGALEPATKGEVLLAGRTSGTLNNCAFTRNAAGAIWIAANGRTVELKGGKLEPVDFDQARQSGFVMGVGAASDGALWVVRDGRIRKWRDGHWTEDRGPCPWHWKSVTDVLELRDGTLAIGTMDEGCYLVFADGRSRQFDHSSGLAQDWVRFLYEDREGNLWVGAGTGGLAAVRPTAFSVLNPPDQWQGHTVLSVAPAPDGSLWIGTEGAGLYRYHNETWTKYSDKQGLRNLFVWSVAAGRDGDIWAGTWGGGVYRLQGENFVQAIEPELAAVPVLALHFADGDQALWVGTGAGLLHWKNDRATWDFRSQEGIAANVCAIARDRGGQTWLGLSEGGLIRLADGKLKRFRKADGLSSNSVQCLLADGDVLWIGTPDGGLDRLKGGRFSAIGVREGLASNVICHIEDDGKGYLWLSTHHGILRMAKSELNRCADGRLATVTGQVYDRNDGLPTIEYSGGLQAAGCTTTDGRLWFTSSKGLVSVDPAHIRLNPIPPPVVIESLRVDGQEIETTGPPATKIQLLPDHQRLEFQYTALSLVAASKVLFKYRLVGLDQSWVSAGPKRTAFYSHLPPGAYRFQVIACNNDNVWNVTGSTLAFSVLPFYWQTWWFRGLVVVSVLTLVGWAVRYQTRRRLHLRLEQSERARALEAERARIAQDIHDDIGASLTRITMLSQSVRGVADRIAQPTDVVLESICLTAHEVTRSLEEIVWAINPRHDTLDSLVSYMGKFAQDVLSAAGVRCRLDLPVNLPPWPLTTQARHNLLLAFKEALNNAVRHAAATEIRIALTLGPHGFVIRIEDNGLGIEAMPLVPAAVSGRRTPGNGLQNMQHRLTAIGGRCEFASEPGGGLCVSFFVDVPSSPHDPDAGTS
jgi:ligand-binding sensor domain-containing protein/signal transduction histidine kinase